MLPNYKSMLQVHKGKNHTSTPKLQNVFVYYKMYSVPSPHKDFLLNNFYIIISREKLRGGGGGVY